MSVVAIFVVVVVVAVADVVVFTLNADTTGMNDDGDVDDDGEVNNKNNDIANDCRKATALLVLLFRCIL